MQTLGVTAFAELAATSDRVAATSKRNAKVAALAELLPLLEPAEVRPATAFLVGSTTLGRVGVGWASIGALDAAPAQSPSLAILDVQMAIENLAAATGEGSMAQRRALLDALFARATVPEQRLLRAILGGELRQGALDGVLASAIAAAADVPVGAVRRAAMFAGDLGEAAAVSLAGGRGGLAAIELEPLRPVEPMLASTAPSAAEALEGGSALVEVKLDGARIQAHRRGHEVRVFTRNLNDVTDRLPAVVRQLAEYDGGDLVLDGEAIGLLDDGSPQAFQDTISEFASDEATPLHAFFFDVLYVDGVAVHDEPLRVRREALERVVPAAARLRSIVTDDPADAERFFAEAVSAGQEGVVVKSLDAPYAAGRRGSAWRKVKPVHTFDLVVLAVEWGHGRRRGRLSNLHLGARDGDNLVMVGKTFKGLTDEMLDWQTQRFLDLQSNDDGHVVTVRPEQVVEVAIDGVQRSTRYPGGVALRFARVRRYRDDKPVAEIDTIGTLRRL
ncbi:MAG: ATP-dependent DNA ligase [Actinomycetota bacterium]